MSLADLKRVYMVLCVILGLVIISPSLFAVVSLPKGEQFSELYILDSEHMLNIPSQIKPNSSYKVYLGIGNHMGETESYLVYAKLRNQTEPLPDNIAGTPSSLAPIFEFRVILTANEIWEKEVIFSFDNISINGNVYKVSELSINGQSVRVDKVGVKNNGFIYQLFFELWIYNRSSSDFEFHNRSVGFNLNLTET